MYPLDKGIIYIYKPPIYLRYDECNKVEFERTGGQVWTLTFFLSIYFFIFKQLKMNQDVGLGGNFIYDVCMTWRLISE